MRLRSEDEQDARFISAIVKELEIPVRGISYPKYPAVGEDWHLKQFALPDREFGARWTNINHMHVVTV